MKRSDTDRSVAAPPAAVDRRARQTGPDPAEPILDYEAFGRLLGAKMRAGDETYGNVAARIEQIVGHVEPGRIRSLREGKASAGGGGPSDEAIARAIANRYKFALPLQGGVSEGVPARASTKRPAAAGTRELDYRQFALMLEGMMKTMDITVEYVASKVVYDGSRDIDMARRVGELKAGHATDRESDIAIATSIAQQFGMDVPMARTTEAGLKVPDGVAWPPDDRGPRSTFAIQAMIGHDRDRGLLPVRQAGQGSAASRRGANGHVPTTSQLDYGAFANALNERMKGKLLAADVVKAVQAETGHSIDAGRVMSLREGESTIVDSPTDLQVAQLIGTALGFEVPANRPPVGRNRNGRPRR